MAVIYAINYNDFAISNGLTWMGRFRWGLKNQNIFKRRIEAFIPKTDSLLIDRPAPRPICFGRINSKGILFRNEFQLFSALRDIVR